MSKKALGIVLPDEWSVARLADISDVRDGTHDSPKYLESGIPFITSKNLKNGKLDFTTCNFISEEDHRKFSERSNVQNGDIIFGMIGTLGSPVIVDTDFEFSIKNVALIKFNNTQLFNQYMKYLLDSTLVQREFERISDGGVQKFISLSTIRSLQIPIPPLKEQQKIAEILSSVDAAIEKTEQVIAKTEEVKKGLMQQLLTKGIGHTEFKQTELGEIPVEWEVKKIKEICEVVSGGTPKTSVAEYWDSEDVVWITPTDITSHSGKYIADSSRKISKKGLEESSANLLPIGSVLMCSRATIGPRAINTVPVSTNQGFKSFICSSAINNQFLYYLIDVLKEFFIKNASGSTFLEVSKSTVENCLIALPSIDEQMRIVDILSNIDYKSTNEQEKLLKLNYMKQGLMQQLLTGKTRVKID